MKKHLNTLFITTEDTWLALDGETVSVRMPGREIVRVPLVNLEAIQTFGWNIMATPQLMAHCAECNVHISFCSPHGRFLCRVTGYAPGNVLLRRAQYRLADDPIASVSIAREIVAAKILNARTVLLRVGRDYSERAAALQGSARALAGYVQQARQASSAAQLLGIEGAAAECYFSAFPLFLLSNEWAFSARNRRPPLDPVNSLLSFVYTLLTADCKSALEAVGLDHAVGVYHRERPGRPALALDLVEEFRAPLADRTVLTLLNRKQLSPRDFVQEEGGFVRLSDDARKLVITTWQERKKTEVLHPFLQERMTIGMLPHIQARLLAQHIRGTLDAYPPMLWK